MHDTSQQADGACCILSFVTRVSQCQPGSFCSECTMHPGSRQCLRKKCITSEKWEEVPYERTRIEKRNCPTLASNRPGVSSCPVGSDGLCRRQQQACLHHGKGGTRRGAHSPAHRRGQACRGYCAHEYRDVGDGGAGGS